MDAIVTAGGIPKPGEPLYDYTRGAPKALLNIAGKPMIQWVLDALDGASRIEHVIIIGLTEESGIQCKKAAVYLPNQGSMVHNLRAGMSKMLEINPRSQHLLTVSSDIPAITPQMVDWLVDRVQQTDDDAYYNVITRQVMEARYPDSRRSYVRLKDVELCGGDMHAVRTRLGPERDELWERLLNARKNALKQASLIGFDTLFLLFFHLVPLDRAVSLVSRRLKIRARAIMCPYAEIGMDVDKPHQFEIMQADLARRVAV